MASDSSSAFFSLTQAEYAAGNFKQKVAEGSMSARIRVGAGVDNVAGVKLPVFTKYDTGAVADNQSLGLVGGGKKIVAVREKFTLLLENLIKYVCHRNDVHNGHDVYRVPSRVWIDYHFILLLTFTPFHSTDSLRFKPPL